MDKRFITIHKEGFGFNVRILVDKETGVNYIFAQNGNGGGLTVLLDKDGKPVITPVNNYY